MGLETEKLSACARDSMMHCYKVPVFGPAGLFQSARRRAAAIVWSDEYIEQGGGNIFQLGMSEKSEEEWMHEIKNQG